MVHFLHTSDVTFDMINSNKVTDLPIFLFDKYKQRYEEIQSIAKDFYAKYVKPQKAKYNMIL